MKIITQLVILSLALLLVNADEHCDNLLNNYNQFKRDCSPGRLTIKSCCDLIGLPRYRAPNGIYQMRKCIPSYEKITPFTTLTSDILCEMGDDGGGWLIIQRNDMKTQVNFTNKKWSDYEEGFGNLKSHFWYGLKSIHCLTQNNSWEMKLIFKFKNHDWHHLHYNWFSVGRSREKYPLTIGGFTHGRVDWFASHQVNGMKFSTPDNDNDASSGNCAIQWKSGWWYNNCTDININSQPPYVRNHDVEFTQMMIRPRECMVY